MTTLDIIKVLPFELQARLQCDPYFADVPIVVAEKGNVKLEIDRQQAVIAEKGGKRGVAVAVLQMAANDDYENLQAGPMTLRPAFQVVENIELNRDVSGTGKFGVQVARRIRDVIKMTILEGLVKPIRPAKPCIYPVPLSKDIPDGIRAHQVDFECLEGMVEELAQVAMPNFSQTDIDEPKFQITCPTDGATIWFTTDDSYPMPTNLKLDSTARQYSSPIPIPPLGITVRAIAFKNGLLQSSVRRATITIS